jgi:invasion protein IalB
VPSAAQTGAPTPTAAITQSDVSGSWVVRCYRTDNADCDISQVLSMRGKNVRVLSAAIAFVPKTNQYVGRFVVPLGVAFAPGLTIEMGTFRATHLRYRRCERDGCYVEGILPDALVAAMQTPGLRRGLLDIVSIDGRNLQIPVVLDGFSDGLAMLKQWAAQKAGKK